MALFTNDEAGSIHKRESVVSIGDDDNSEANDDNTTATANPYAKILCEE
jgi:hypothetical protein